MAEPADSSSQRIHPRAAFQSRAFGFFQLMRLLALLAVQIQGLTVAPHLYLLTKSPLFLGMIGLVMFLPQFLFWIPAGQVADRFNRKKVILVCEVGLLLCTAALILFTIFGSLHVPESTLEGEPEKLLGLGEVYPFFIIMFLVGTCRTFLNPASSALMPSLVPREHFPNAVMWHSFNFQLSTTIAGLSVGSLITWSALSAEGRMHPEFIYGFTALLSMLSAVILVFFVKPGSKPETAPDQAPAEQKSWKTLLAGLHYVFNRPVLLGAISLDLFAVLLGGATSLLLIFAIELLGVGPGGFGKLEAAQSIGALIMGLVFTHLPAIRRAGWVMLACVGAFGLATVLFGISRSFWISIVLVVFIGAVDMVSMIIRQSIIQLRTPDNMRGRVTAVNMVVVGASNQLGEFRAGVMAHWWGPVTAVIFGGACTLAIVLLWAWLFPALRNFGRLDEDHTQPPPEKSPV